MNKQHKQTLKFSDFMSFLTCFFFFVFLKSEEFAASVSEKKPF